MEDFPLIKVGTKCKEKLVKPFHLSSAMNRKKNWKQNKTLFLVGLPSNEKMLGQMERNVHNFYFSCKGHLCFNFLAWELHLGLQVKILWLTLVKNCRQSLFRGLNILNFDKNLSDV